MSNTPISQSNSQLTGIRNTPAPITQPCQWTVNINGTELVLTADRLAWWPEQQTVLIADAHFGKAATFRNSGIAVPEGTTSSMLSRLSAALQRFGARRLIILGDFIHSATRAARDFEDDLMNWRREKASLSITLIRGNHDRGCDDLFSTLDLDVLDAALEIGPFLLCHDPTAATHLERGSFCLGGHLHPGFRLNDVDSRRLPCFWLTTSQLVFPAFGLFTGLAQVRPAANDLIFAISENQIAQLNFTAKQK